MRRTLIETLEALLRIAHPIIPFVTETLWKGLPPAVRDGEDTIMLRPFPLEELGPSDAESELAVDWVQSVVNAVRNIRGEMNLNPGQMLPLILQGGTARDRAWLAETEPLLRRLAKVSTPDWLTPGDTAPAASVPGWLAI